VGAIGASLVAKAATLRGVIAPPAATPAAFVRMMVLA
jgi:hypothetical protein